MGEFVHAYDDFRLTTGYYRFKKILYGFTMGGFTRWAGLILIILFVFHNINMEIQGASNNARVCHSSGIAVVHLVAVVLYVLSGRL